MIATVPTSNTGETFEIIDQRVIPSPDVRRRGKEDVICTVELDSGATLLIRLPAETYTHQALQAEIIRQTQTSQQQGKRHTEILQRTESPVVPEPQSSTGSSTSVWFILILVIAVGAVLFFSLSKRLRR